MGSYLADTNLLLRLADPDSEQHAVATEALARLLGQGHEVYLTPQNFIEFWAVTTRPVEGNGFGWTSEPRGNRQMKGLLDQAANAAVKTKGSIFELIYRRHYFGMRDLYTYPVTVIQKV